MQSTYDFNLRDVIEPLRPTAEEAREPERQAQVLKQEWRVFLNSLTTPPSSDGTEWDDEDLEFFDMKRHSDEIDPTLFPQLFYLLWYRIGIITPQEAFTTYETQWRFVNYEMMSNDERKLLIELIDELSDGIFEPFFDDLRQDRRQVIVELKMMTYDEMIEERAKFIGPQLLQQQPKMQVKLTPQEELKLQEFADRLVAFQMSKLPGDTGSD